MIVESGLKVSWTCNSRVDYVDEEMLRLMGKAGCWYISWGIESARRADPEAGTQGLSQRNRSLGRCNWAHAAGINNWGYFIIGLPGETEETIQETIAYAKELPLDIACSTSPRPIRARPSSSRSPRTAGSGRAPSGKRWTWTSPPCWTIPDLPAERLEYWQRRATREWSLRPGPMLTFLKGMNSWEGFKSAVSVGMQTLKFMRGSG